MTAEQNPGLSQGCDIPAVWYVTRDDSLICGPSPGHTLRKLRTHRTITREGRHTTCALVTIRRRYPPIRTVTMDCAVSQNTDVTAGFSAYWHARSGSDAGLTNLHVVRIFRWCYQIQQFPVRANRVVKQITTLAGAQRPHRLRRLLAMCVLLPGLDARGLNLEANRRALPATLLRLRSWP